MKYKSYGSKSSPKSSGNSPKSSPKADSTYNGNLNNGSSYLANCAKPAATGVLIGQASESAPTGSGKANQSAHDTSAIVIG